MATVANNQSVSDGAANQQAPSDTAATQTTGVAPIEVARTMLANDGASQLLNMRLGKVDFGRAEVILEVTAQLVNGHGSCHGGIIFTLADTAFASACNTYNQITVGSDCSINYIRPGRIGDTLTATAVEAALQGRSGLYDVSVTNQNNEIVALFHGRSRRIGGEVVATTNGVA